MSTGITRGSSYLATLVLEYLCLTEEEGSLCPCGLVGIGGVDRVSFCRFGVESPDRPWLSLRRVGRTDHLSKCGDRIIPLEEYRYYWARGHEGDEVLVEGPLCMDSIELAGLRLGEVHHPHRPDSESLLLEVGDDLPGQIPGDRIWFDDGECISHLLSSEEFSDDLAPRQEAGESPLSDDGELLDVLVDHHVRSLIDPHLFIDTEYGPAHDLSDFEVTRYAYSSPLIVLLSRPRQVWQECSHQLPLGDDPQDLILLPYDWDRSNSLPDHQIDRLSDRGVCGDTRCAMDHDIAYSEAGLDLEISDLPQFEELVGPLDIV